MKVTNQFSKTPATYHVVAANGSTAYPNSDQSLDVIVSYYVQAGIEFVIYEQVELYETDEAGVVTKE